MTDDQTLDSRVEGHRRAIEGFLRTEFGQRTSTAGERAINRLRIMASVDGDSDHERVVTEHLRAAVRDRSHSTPRRGTASLKRISSRLGRVIPPSRSRSPVNSWFGAAAAILLVGVLCSVVVLQRASTKSDLLLTTVTGAATITHANGTTTLARSGMVIHHEDLISVGSSSSINVQFADGTVMTSGSASEWINESNEAGKRIRLLIGNISANVKKQSVDRPFMVTSNDAEVIVVGTELTCQHRGSSRVSVTTGEVAVRRRSDNVAATVAAGQEVEIGLDGPLQVVKIGQAKNEIEQIATDGTGTGTGLYGQYFQNQGFTDEVFARIDPTIDFTLGINQAIDPRIKIDTYSIRWTGEIEPKYSGLHWFRTLSDDGIRIWIDGKLIIERWSEHNATWDDGTIELLAGKRYPIRIEYDQWQKHAVLRVFWKVMGHPLTILDRSQLYPRKPNE